MVAGWDNIKVPPKANAFRNIAFVTVQPETAAAVVVISGLKAVFLANGEHLLQYITASLPVRSYLGIWLRNAWDPHQAEDVLDHVSVVCVNP